MIDNEFLRDFFGLRREASSPTMTGRGFTITEIVCPTCGVAFWIRQTWLAAMDRAGQTFYCPNAHGIGRDAASRGAEDASSDERSVGARDART